MNAKHPILFVISTLAAGGAEKQTIDLVNGLDKRKYNIFVCYFEKKEYLRSKLNEEELGGVFCLNKKGRFDFGMFARYKRVLDVVRPKIVLCVDMYPSLFAHLIRITSFLKFYVIQVMHSTIAPTLYNEIIVRVLYAKLINKSDRIVFVCKNQLLYWVDNYHIRSDISECIHNGVDISSFQNEVCIHERERAKVNLKISNDDFVICICAGLRPEKKHTDLIDAAGILVSRGCSIKVIVVGEGVERGRIEEHINFKKANDFILLSGLQSDVRPIMSMADVVVICSIAVETFSIAILEAMAMKKAIIASDIGGASEQVIHGDNGFLFQPGDVLELADRLQCVIDGRLADKMGARSRELVVEHFSMCKMVQRYEELFDSTLRVA